jgi:hypothetical protein
MLSSGMLLRVPLVFLRSVFQLLVIAKVVPSSPIHVTLMKKALHSSVTSALIRATECHTTEDGNLQKGLINSALYPLSGAPLANKRFISMPTRGKVQSLADGAYNEYACELRSCGLTQT